MRFASKLTVRPKNGLFSSKGEHAADDERVCGDSKNRAQLFRLRSR